tara:strand:+ start:134 stop:310 length:177 start_codon:yes stop_codon:yes gene_type:complete
MSEKRKYDPYKDPRNSLRGIDREELEEWRRWADDWKRKGSRRNLRESVNMNRRNERNS